MTISSLFIRRPRLAFVISTVITIAGLLALTRLPVAQFPDIVPPQVRVTATYPGASAQAVEESVAQVIEGQVNGVERMLYMKSTSGGDGSYQLTISFEVGSNPDLNTVRINGVICPVLEATPSTLTVFIPADGSHGAISDTAIITVVNPYIYTVTVYGWVQKHYGPINASGDAQDTSIDEVLRSAPDGAKPKLTEAQQSGIDSVRLVSKINSAVSCDMVTEAGAGGKFLNLIE